MITASYRGAVLAQAETVVHVEGNDYFPRASVNEALLVKSWLRTLCYWKGVARYYHLAVEEELLRNRAWTYPLPSPLAWKLKDMVAFDRSCGILIEEQPS